MSHPLLPVATAFAAGILCSPPWMNALEPLGAATVAAALAGSALWLRRHTLALAAALAGVCCAGAAFAALERQSLPRDHIARLAASGAADLSEPLRMTGWVARPAEPREFSEAFELALESIESRQQAMSASGRVRLYHYLREGEEPPLKLRYGERITALARIRPVRGFWNPGSFDREAYARRQGVMFQGTVKAEELVERLPESRGGALEGLVLATRRYLLQHIDRLYPLEGPPDPTNAILRAMLLGDRSGLDRRTSDDFEKTGTYHALVISGMNTAAICAFLLAGMHLLRAPRAAATLVVLAFMAAFVPLTGGSPPVARAGVMCGLYMVARLLFRERALLNTIAASAILLLAANPEDLQDGGFQLSFFAVLLIAGLGAPLVEATMAPYRKALRDLANRELDPQYGRGPQIMREWLREIGEDRRLLSLRWMERLAGALLSGVELLAVGVVIQIGFALPMAALFHRGGWVAVPANLLVVPLSGVIVPLGMVTVGLSVLSPALAALPAVPLAWSVALMVEVTHWHAGFSLAARRVPPPPWWLGAALATLLLALAVLLIRKRWIWASATAVAALACSLAVTSHPFPPELPAGRLEITTLDVSQGDSLFVTADQRTLLVDAGGYRDTEFGTDTGADVVAPYLWQRGVRALDAVALTHAHQDHIGGLPSILRNFQVGEIWIGRNPDSDPLDRLITLAAFYGVPVRRRDAGETQTWGRARFDFLSPGEDYRVGKRVSNNDSLVMRVTYGRRTALLPGDIERRIERELAKNGAPLAADFLKVPHHGSKTSSNDEFLERVRAPFGVISVAVHSPFGHPHEEALERLRQAGVVVYRTDRDGAVTWTTDGYRMWITTFREQSGRRLLWNW